MTTLAPQTLQFGSHFGALVGFGCKSENRAPVEMGTLLRPSEQTLLGVILAHFLSTPKKKRNKYKKEALKKKGPTGLQNGSQLSPKGGG